MLRAPCVAHLRDFEDVSIITKSYARLINHHIAISSVIKDNLLELGVPDERISIIHDSIDLYEFNADISCDYLYDEFGIDNKTKAFGIFGRIVEWKGIREFVLAAAEVFKKVPVSHAFIVGDYTDDGEKYLKEVRILVSDLGLKEKIVFTGFRSDVSQFMKFMDVVVHASITPEPFGMVVIEGMAMAKPVIAAASGGPLDIIENGKTGLLVDPKNINEFADSIIKVLNNPSFAKSLGACGRRRVEQLFTNKKAVADIEKIYDGLIANM
jgi:glycosyltransferase involved in cell wall biosynthesis